MKKKNMKKFEQVLEPYVSGPIPLEFDSYGNKTAGHLRRDFD